jgi:hypothetical protein
MGRVVEWPAMPWDGSAWVVASVGTARAGERWLVGRSGKVRIAQAQLVWREDRESVVEWSDLDRPGSDSREIGAATAWVASSPGALGVGWSSIALSLGRWGRRVAWVVAWRVLQVCRRGWARLVAWQGMNGVVARGALP